MRVATHAPYAAARRPFGNHVLGAGAPLASPAVGGGHGGSRRGLAGLAAQPQRAQLPFAARAAQESARAASAAELAASARILDINHNIKMKTKTMAECVAAEPEAAAAAPRLAAPDARRAAVLATVRQQVTAHRDAFYVVDLAELAYKFKEWTSQLPRVRPYYAVKCNDDARVVQTLAALGAGFDCATKGEISMALGQGVKADDIIFAHPAKQPSHLQYARKKGVAKMTFDNVDELRKIAREHPGAQVVLRILTDDSASVCRLGLKFGAPLSAVRELLAAARELKLDVLGVSYHVGSGNGKAESFAGAVRDARAAFDIAASMGMPLRLLDIGGGFPGSTSGVDLADEAAAEARAAEAAVDEKNPYAKHPSFRTIAKHVRAALDTHFPEGCDVRIIAEPGRFFVKSTHTLAVNIVGKRATVDEASAAVEATPKTRWNYYVNDGLYGSFNCVLYDHAVAYPNIVLRTAAAPPQQVLAQQQVGEQPQLQQLVGELDLSQLERLRAGGSAAHALSVEPAHNAVATVAHNAPHPDSVARLDSATGAVHVSDAVGLEHAAHLASSLRFLQQAAQQSAAASSHQYQRHGGARQMQMRGLRTSASAPAPSAFGPLFPTTLWGPTCDSIDKITDVAVLPELDIGDWLVFENMGAYTVAGSCMFNGFPISTKVYRNLDGSLSITEEAETA